MEKQWKKDVAFLAGITGAGLLAAAVLIPTGKPLAAGIGVEGLMLALMFAPCLAWRASHREE